jgi:hypothetical protein
MWGDEDEHDLEGNVKLETNVSQKVREHTNPWVGWAAIA